jgi:GT2 family glycosyltransferase
LPLPAHQLLHPASAVRPAWAVFDRDWYLRWHADARAFSAGKPAEAALLYYLRVGAGLGHSPSPLFDELFYLARNPAIAELVRGGQYASGFDHYCQHGHRCVSPHWLFDDALYADLYEDMTLENLAAHDCHGRYDHYLRSGQREARMGHFLFDGQFYAARAVAAGVDAAELERLGPYVHFLYRLGAEEELASSIYFDPVWYVERQPGARAEIARGRYGSAIQHYLTHPSPELFDPVPEFSEPFYRRRYSEIAAAIDCGMYRSGYQQFIQHGAFELRQPSAGIDLAYYRDMHERVRDDLNAGRVRDAFAHLRLIGLREGLAHAPPAERPVLNELATRELFIAKAQAGLAVFARMRLDFSHAEPVLSVIMVAFERFELTMQALASLRANGAGGIELILVDNGSSDATRRIGEYVTGAKILRTTQNLGFLQAANLALREASAPAVLYLNNDVELGFGAVAAALARLHSDPRIGAVGAKIIRSNGRLQEAGSIIWRDGTTSGYLRDGAPLAPEANFLREVDYCSGVFLMCRAEILAELGGFDAAYAPAYFEDADLCARMRGAGYVTLYDPAVTVHHLEFGSAASSEASMALMRRGRRIFKTRQAAFLAGQMPASAQNTLAARSRSARPSLLLLEDTVPLRRLGSGFVRCNDIVHAIDAAGYDVQVFPLNGAPYDIASLFGDFPERTEVLHDLDFTMLPEFLKARAAMFDIIWIARTHNVARVMPLLAQAGIDPARMPVVLDTEAIAANREAARAALAGEAFDLRAAAARELAGTEICATVLAVSDQEATELRALGLANVSVLGTARHASPESASFAARDGLLFVAGFHQADSPNLDALDWYMAEIQPALAAILGEAPMLHVVGHAAAGIDLSRFAKNARITLHGEVSDLTPYYAAARVFIAPTRFAAGTPYKIYEAASFGLPCVVTELLRGQLGWEMASAPVGDARRFAAAVAALYRSEAEWSRQRAAALARIENEHGFVDFNAAVAQVLQGVRSFRMEGASASFSEEKEAERLLLIRAMGAGTANAPDPA